MVRKFFVQVFGSVKTVELIKDSTGRFRGVVNVEFNTEMDARKA
jgi:hypothetical protein